MGFPFYVGGSIYQKRNRIAEAERAFRMALKLNPSHPLWNARVGAILLGKKAFEEALSFYEKACEFSPETATFHFHRGRCLTVLNRKNEAVAAFEEAIKRKKDPTYFSHLADLHRKRGKRWEEVEALQRATSLNSKKAAWHFRLGEAYEAMGSLSEAVASYERATHMEKNPQWLYRLGYTLSSLGEHSKAAESYRHAISLDKKSKASRLGVGVYHEANKSWDLAAAAYSDQIKATPLHPELHFAAGYAWDRCYQWDQAKAHYINATRLAPEKAEWHFRLGFVHERLNELDEAATSYSVAALTRKAHTPYWYYRWARVLQKASRYEEAASVFAHIRPLIQPADQPLEQSSYMSKCAYAVASKISEALRSSTSNAYLDRKALQLFMHSGNSEGIVRLHEDAVARSQSFSAKRYSELGHAFMKVGDFEQACIAFSETEIASDPHGVKLSAYDKNPGRVAVMQYNEMLNRPIKARTIVYESFGGEGMSCSPYAIFKKLLHSQEFADWTHVWVLKDVSKAPLSFRGHSNIIFVQRESDLYRRYLATASHLINNSTFPTWFIRRDGQKYLNTWHGTPLKTLGTKMRGRFQEHKNGARNFLQATHLITPNAHTSSVTLDDFGLKGLIEHKLRETGYPRIDLLVNSTDESKADLREQLGLAGDKPVILYAPTWRGTHGSVEMDVNKLKNDLLAMKGTGCDVLFRGHSMVQNSISKHKLDAIIVPDDIDTTELLSVVDILITDYSSIFFDFLPADRPIIYYAYDLEEYVSDRGMYFDMSDMPGTLCKTQDELVTAIAAATKTIGHPQQYDLGRFNPHDDGDATERCVDFFFNETPKANITAKKKILFFAGPFMPNGITAAFISLVWSLDPSVYDLYLVIDPDGIQREPERLELFNRLPSYVNVIARTGIVAQTFEERWLNDMIEKYAGAPSDQASATHKKNMVREFRRIFGDTTFDSLVNFEGYQRFWSKLFSSGSSPRKSIYLHNDMCSEWQTKYPDMRHLFESYKDYDQLLSVSPAMSETNQRELSTRFDIPHELFNHCENVIDVNAISDKSSLLLDDDLLPWFSPVLKTFVNVGRLSPEKDQKKLILAFAEINKRFPHTRLVVVGDGPLRHQLESLIDEMNLAPVVLLAGLRPNAVAIINAGTCFVLSSNHEGQPIVLLEAMTLGKPIVATDITGNRGVMGPSYGALVENSKDGLQLGMAAILEGTLTECDFNANAYSTRAVERFIELNG